MGIIRRGVSTDNTNTTDLISMKPTGTVEGDLITSFFITDEANTITPPDGSWTEFGAITGLVGMNARSFWKEAGSSEPSSYTFTQSATGAFIGTLVSYYEDSNPGVWSLEDESGNREASDNSITSSSVTAINNSLLVIGFGNDDNEVVTASPSGMTNNSDFNITSIATATYYELRNAGGVTKSITWGGGAEELTANVGVFFNTPGAGYSNKILGIIPSKVDGIDSSNISKIIGV